MNTLDEMFEKCFNNAKEPINSQQKEDYRIIFEMGVKETLIHILDFEEKEIKPNPYSVTLKAIKLVNEVMQLEFERKVINGK